MTETIIAGTELNLTVRVETGGEFTVRWDKLATAYIFHNGFAAILKFGSGKTEGMIELARVRVDADMESVGHVEPLLSD